MIFYDSRADTLAHIHRVRDFLGDFVSKLLVRGSRHDASKLGPEEKPALDVAVPLFKTAAYDSPEYRAAVKALGPYHKANNSHHPEFYWNGVEGMDLFDLVEMFCDWRAAAERGPTPSDPNIKVNALKYRLDPQIAAIFENTLTRWPRDSVPNNHRSDNT